MRGAPGGNTWPCTAPHAAHTGTHIHSPSQPAASGPWAEPGARSSPPPPSHGMPGRDTPRWSPVPPALEHKCGEGRRGCQDRQGSTLLSLPSLLLAPRQSSTAHSVPSPAGTQAELHSLQCALSCLCPCSPSLPVRREETLGIILLRLQLLSYHVSILGNQPIHIPSIFQSVHGSALHRFKSAAMSGACVQACTCVERVCKHVLACAGGVQGHTRVPGHVPCRGPQVGDPRRCQPRSKVQLEAEHPWEAGRLPAQPLWQAGIGREPARRRTGAALTSEGDAGVAAQVPLQLGIVHLLCGRERGGERREDASEIE